MTRRRAATAAITLLLAVLTACGDDETAVPVEEAPDNTAAPAPDAPAALDDDEADGDDGPDAGDEPPEQPVQGPQQGEWVSGCQELVARGSSTIGAHDAGEVEVEISGDEITGIEVRANPGWVVKDEDWDDDEVKVGFEQDERKVEFEADLDDGELEIEICVKS